MIKTFQLIDECVFPETSYYYNDPPIGGEYQYLLFEEDTGEWGLYIWDKNEIGSLHGSACIQEKVSYGKTE